MLLRGKITRQIASCSIARLLVLTTDEYRLPIVIHIDSPGGAVAEGLGVISTMNGIRSPVGTFCRGEAGGTAAAIAAHGVKGCRVAAAEARFSFKLPEEDSSRHRTSGHESFLRTLSEIIARDSGQEESEVMAWFREGTVFNAQEALAHGLIDQIAPNPILPPASPSVMDGPQ